MVSKIWVVTFAAMLDFKRSFTRVQNEENLCYNLHIKNCVNYYLGFEVRREKPFKEMGLLKFPHLFYSLPIWSTVFSSY